MMCSALRIIRMNHSMTVPPFISLILATGSFHADGKDASFLCATGLSILLLVIAETSGEVFVLFSVLMAAIIETEFGIRTLRVALVERRNKDRLGHLFL